MTTEDWKKFCALVRDLRGAQQALDKHNIKSNQVKVKKLEGEVDAFVQKLITEKYITASQEFKPPTQPTIF